MRYLYVGIATVLLYFYFLFCPNWLKYELTIFYLPFQNWIILFIVGMALNKIWSQYLEIKELKDSIETKERNEIGFKKD